MLRLLLAVLLVAAPAAAQDDLVPTFPKPASEGGPALPPEDEVAPAFPKPASEGGPALPPEDEVAPAFPKPASEGGPALPADDDDSAAPTPAPEPVATPRPDPVIAEEMKEVFLATEQLAQRIEDAEGQLAQLTVLRMRATTPQALRELDAQIDEIKNDAAQMRDALQQLAAGVDLDELSAAPESDISWDQELTDLLSPMLHEVKRATERPRETERLRILLAHYTEAVPKAEGAIDHVELLLAAATDPLQRAELEATLEELQDRRDALKDEREVVQGQLASLSQSSASVTDALSNLMRVFFAERGRNVVAAVGALFLVLAVCLVLRRFVFRLLGLRTGRKSGLLLRVLDLAALLGAMLAAGFAGLTVLFVSGDWVLLTLAALILVGLFWGLRQSIPNAWNEIRLLLNVGPVREGERVIYEGLPWLVESLQFVSILRNPAFPGVYIRLPLGALDGLVSRPFLEDEPWFPTAVGDWIEIDDGTCGQVVSQSPEVVRIRRSGGLYDYPAADFAASTPVNLSRGWRTNVLLTLDYRHQAEVTNSIPDTLQDYLRLHFQGHELHPHMSKLTVGFEQMADSSLDLEISAWFDGAGAEDWEKAAEDLGALCVDACTEHGWTIAFPQMTITKRD